MYVAATDDNLAYPVHDPFMELNVCSFRVTVFQWSLHWRMSLCPQMSKPVGQILLADVSRVGPAFIKDASFAFEVHFRGKGSSPWVLNTTTNVSVHVCLARNEWLCKGRENGLPLVIYGTVIYGDDKL